MSSPLPNSRPWLTPVRAALGGTLLVVSAAGAAGTIEMGPALLGTAGLCLLIDAARLGLRGTKRAEAQARELARRDAMTGLLDRMGFLTELDGLARRQKELGASLAVLTIDLDGLKELNESCGHESGDAAIRSVAEALRRAAGRDAAIGRLGGDEFAVARPSMASREAVEAFAASLLAAIRAPRIIDGQAIALGARIGVARLPDDGTTAMRLMKGADLALNQARRKADSGFVLFEPQIEDELQRRRDLEQQIRQTLAASAFDLHFQPLFETAGGKLLGFEALLRMPAAGGGFVSPALFIPVAEEIGLIGEIGAFVLRRACAVAATWPEHLSVAVNLSPAEFKKGGVHRLVAEALGAAGLAPHRLQLEITEGLMLSDDAEIMAELAALKGLGVTIAMDDFGTGYSSLAYLWKFPFDKIKIDRSFMRAFDTDERHVAMILQTIMSLSRALNMRVTAEGVETEGQAAFLGTIGCDEVQGFHFGRPMPLTDVAAVVLKDAQRRNGLDAAPEPERLAG